VYRGAPWAVVTDVQGVATLGLRPEPRVARWRHAAQSSTARTSDGGAAVRIWP
jgi:hypothetical protein